MPVNARFTSSASRWTTATSPSGECWIQTASLVMPRRLREASYAVLRSPCQQERIALRSRSVLPGNSGIVNATACVRGHEKVPTGGQVEVTAGGQ
jgi:hypothetical protein